MNMQSRSHVAGYLESVGAHARNVLDEVIVKLQSSWRLGKAVLVFDLQHQRNIARCSSAGNHALAACTTIDAVAENLEKMDSREFTCWGWRKSHFLCTV